MIKITESGLTFGPFAESNLYHIEQSNEYRKIEQGTKIAEFIFWKESNQKLVILEAKTTLADEAGSPAAFQEQIDAICEKFLNSLDLYLSSALKKQLHPHFETIDYRIVEFRFILVISQHDLDGIRHVNDALSRSLTKALRLRKIWSSSICTINGHQAHTRGLLEDDGSFWH